MPPDSTGVVCLTAKLEPTLAFALWLRLHMFVQIHASATACAYQKAALECCSTDRYAGLLMANKALLLEFAALSPLAPVPAASTQLFTTAKFASSSVGEAIRPLLITTENMVRQNVTIQVTQMLDLAADESATASALAHSQSTEKITREWEEMSLELELELVQSTKL